MAEKRIEILRVLLLPRRRLLLLLCVTVSSLLSPSPVLHAYELPSMWQLTPVQEAQLKLEYLELSNGQLFCELRDALARTTDVSLTFSEAESPGDRRLTATIRFRSHGDTSTTGLPIEVVFKEDSAGLQLADPDLLRRELGAVAARLSVGAQAATFPCGPSSFCESPNLFVPKALSSIPSVWIMNRSAAQAGWGIDLFARSSGISSYVYIDPLRSYNYVAVSDPNWDRIVAAEDTIAGTEGRGMMAFGQTGSGTGNLRSPRGVCAFGSYLYVADCYNNRVIKYLARNSTFETQAQYTGFNKPTDVDLHVGNYLVIANAGDNSVVIQGIMSVTAVHTSPSCAGSAPSFSYPVSVAVGRNPSTGTTNNDVYVADAGNRRLVRFTVIQNGLGIYEAAVWTCYDFLPVTDVALTSVDVDYLGYVYATDALNGKIYKFDRNLLPIASFGSLGQGGSQLYYPEGIDFVQGSRWVNNVGAVELNSLGDVLVTERYSDQTGVRRYYAGTDVLNIAGLWSGPADAYDFSYDLPSPSVVSAQLFIQSGTDWNPHRTLFSNQVYAHGRKNHRFSTTTDPNGRYKVSVSGKSIYGSQTSVSEVEYTVLHNNFNSPPRITSVSFDKFMPNCLVGDGIHDEIRVTAEDPEGTAINLYQFELIHPSNWDPSGYFPIRLNLDPNWVFVQSVSNHTRVDLFTLNPPSPSAPNSESGVSSTATGSEARGSATATAAALLKHIRVRCRDQLLWSPWYEFGLEESSDTCDCENSPPVVERVQFDEFRYYCAATGEKDTVRIWAHDPDGQPLYVHLQVASAGGAKFSFANDTKFSQDTTVTDTAIAFIAGAYATTGLDVVTITVDDRLTCTSIPEFEFQIPVLQDRSACNDAPSFASPLGLRGAPMSCIVNGTLWLAGGAASDPEQDTLMCHWTSVHGHFEFPEGQTTQDTVVRHSDSLWYRAQCPTGAGGSPIQATETITLTLTDPLGGTATSLRSFVIYPSASDCPGSDPGCPYLYAWDGSRWRLENSILASSEGRTDRRDTLYDYYLLSPKMTGTDGTLRLRIAEHEQEVSYLDEVSLFAIDAPIDSRISVDNEGNLYALVEPLYPSSIVDQTGAEHRETLTEPDYNKFESVGSGYLILTYDPKALAARRGLDSTSDDVAYSPHASSEGPPGGEIPPPGKEDTPDKIAAVTTGGVNDTTDGSLQVEISTRRGQWETVTRVFPRISGGPRYVDFAPWVPSSDLPFQVKYSWEKGYSADALMLFRHEPVDLSKISQLPLLSSNHSHEGDVASRLIGADGERVTLIPGEDLALIYGAPAEPGGRSARRYLLRAVGHYVPYASKSMAQVGAALPAEFSLEQNHPNPFNPATEISFALPIAGHVTLTIYNTLGQVTRTLVNGEQSAGYHTVSWDGYNTNGQMAGSGLYLYRIVAGEFTKTRKMVVLK